MIAHSTSERNLKVSNLGPSSEQQALMVRIDWTTSQVVKITARQHFMMPTATMWVRKDGYKVISTQDIPVQEGMTLYFVASKEEGWYYLLQWSENRQQYACTCPAGRIRHTCKHQHILADHLASKEHNIVSTPAAKVVDEPTIAEDELNDGYFQGCKPVVRRQRPHVYNRFVSEVA